MAEETPKSTTRFTRAVTQQLESLHRAGVSHVPKAKGRDGEGEKGRRERRRARRAGDTTNLPSPLTAHPSPLPAGASREQSLTEVAKRVAACTRCPVLVANRTQTVFGVGDPHARLVFIGEAPGADEDRKGEPFVGRAGQLLTDIITKGMKLRREEVYIMNILRCRPPENRTPLPVEAANCREYLDAQLKIIQPQFICCLGACAAQNLLGVDTLIGKLRGRMIDFNGMRALCTYHPSYLLRNPPAKKLVWEDLQVLMAEMGLK